MKSFEHLDLLIGEALESIHEAVIIIREIDSIPKESSKSATSSLGMAIMELWNVRTLVDKISYCVNNASVTNNEFKINSDNGKELRDIYLEAFENETKGKYDEAIQLYKIMLTKSAVLKYSKHLAEAGLYRCSIQRLNA